MRKGSAAFNQWKKDIKALDTAIEWEKYFPRGGRPDLRKAPSRYQIEKIKHLKAEMLEMGAGGVFSGKPSAFRPMRKSRLRDDAQRSLAQPEYLRGILVPNPRKEIVVKRRRDGRVMIQQRLEKGFMSFVPSEFDTIPTADNIRHLMEKALQNPPHGTRAFGLITGNNRLMATDDPDMLIDEAAEMFHKYASMANQGIHRTRKLPNGKTADRGAAAHPREWMNGVYFVLR